MDKNKTSYNGVQALRGIAALSVMLFHFRWNINQVAPGLGDHLFGWGAAGVDLFFLISGFVITLSASKIPQGITGTVSFIKNRALRILPSYYFWLLITFLLCGAMSIFHYADKKENLISAILFMPIYPDHAPFFVDDSGNYGIRWTLNYEIYFYLVVGIMISLPARWFWLISYFMITLIALPIVLTGSSTLNVTGYPTNSALLGLVMNPMIYLFLTGMIIALGLPFLKKLPSTVVNVALTLSFFLCVYMFSQGRFSGHGLSESGWLLGLLLVFTILSEDFLGRYIPNTLVMLGNISYSLYLIHTLINNGVVGRLESMGIQPGWELFLISIAISLVLAYFSWKYIELPLLRKNRLRQGKAATT
ncbi:acyltransferase (plasmid) [Pantoea stewartii]|uniref:acyltransferase family protein n=1 Tax=Pantoea stewartii TaxID=66269 RepID=UPI0013DE5D81|nr:acyltransferase [Pantoea stewartii]QIE99872.1 acyltransferase [Pantoea stewartii]